MDRFFAVRRAGEVGLPCVVVFCSGLLRPYCCLAALQGQKLHERIAPWQHACCCSLSSLGISSRSASDISIESSSCTIEISSDIISFQLPSEQILK
jgi:hypothetical protein